MWVLALMSGIALAICQWLIFAYAPTEATLGIIQKIFYMHLPFALWGMISFLLVFAGSIATLWRKSPWYDNMCAAAAELGLLFSGLGLISGMIWAKKSWGVWWTWDPRLVTTLVMWFGYAAYLVLRNLEMPAQRRRMVCAVAGIIAFLDVPLVFLSARIFRSIHPAVLGAKDGGLDYQMQLVLIACIGALGLLWFALLCFRTTQLGQLMRLDRIKRELLEQG